MSETFADFENHYIEGYAREGNKAFKVTLLSHIVGNLWTGGCPEHGSPAEFQFIVNLYPWEVYPIHDHQVFMQARLLDCGEIPDEKLLYALARHVNECIKVGPTLVHCQAGLNRSALVAGLALIEGGMEPAEAIALLRSRRCDAVLCNQAFERWLLSRSPKESISTPSTPEER